MRHEAKVQDWRAEVDTWWADLLHLPAAALREGGVFAADLTDRVGVVAVDGASAPIVYGPEDVLPALHAATPAGGRDLVSGRAVAAALGSRAGDVKGPAWYGYATTETL